MLEALLHDREEQRALILHTVGCRAAGKKSRLTRADNVAEVRIFLREGRAKPCDACQPSIPPA
ncbi:DUF6233 domain-containing protein [Streptomyces sp. NPDC090306]|uniref:DUF6233 domain-containing protein n=1 Tax=Streptomyces sp. NPDC090306 TaxID=3365961 RepID=UPI0037FCA75B